MANRVNNFGQSNPGEGAGKAVTGVHLVQTPFGTFQVVLAITPGQPDPMAFAINVFQEEVKAGADDPLTATLQRLHEIAKSGAREPLKAGVALLKQMSAAGVIPPMHALLGNAGFSADEIAQLLGEKRPKSFNERVNDVNLN